VAEKVADEKKGKKIGGIGAIGLVALVLVFWGFGWWPFNKKGDESPQTTVQAGPVTPATYTPPVVTQPPPQAQPAPAPVAAPAPAPPAAPAAPPPAPTLSAEDLDKRIAGIADQEVRDCLLRLRIWDVDLSTPSALDAETANCRKAVAAK